MKLPTLPFRYFFFFIFVSSLLAGIIAQNIFLTTTSAPAPSPSPENTLSKVDVEPKTNETKADEVDKIIKDTGWSIPVLNPKMRVKPRVATQVRNVRSYKTEYELQNDFIVPATRKIFAESGLGNGIDEQWRVWSVIQFEKDDVTYCYMMKASKVTLNDDGTVKYRIATAITLNLYDEDADGKFETLEFAALYPEVPRFPKWLADSM